MNGAEPQEPQQQQQQQQQRSVSGSKSLEEAMEEGNGAGVLRGRRASGSGSGEVDAPAAAPEGPRPRVGVNSESEIRWHVRLELALLRRYWPWVAAAIGAEYVHLVAHNLIYYIQGVYYSEGPPPALKDLGLMLLAGRVPERFEWVVGALTCLLVGLVLSLAVARVTLKNVPWGGPQLEVVGHGDPTGSGRPRTVVAAPVAVVLKRASQALALGLSLRVVTFLVTMLPNPADYCHGEHWNPPKNAGEIFTRWAVEGSCGDLMYSGHTTHGMVLTLIIVRYAPGLRWAQATAVTAMVLLALALLTFRSHYTSDVIVAVYVCLMIWRLMPPEPGRLDGDALQIEEHDHDGGVVGAGGRSGVAGGGNGHTAVGSAAASSSPAESFALAQQQRATGAEKQQSQQPLDGAVFADAREALDEEGDGLEDGRRKEA